MFERNLSQTSTDLAFAKYEQNAEQFCDLLFANTGIRAVALRDFQRAMVQDHFAKLPVEVREKKLSTFQAFYVHCQELVAKGRNLRDKKTCLEAFLYRNALTIPDQDDVFSTIENDTFIEIYDNQFTQVYRSADFFQVTNHSVLALELCEWFDLFQRSKDLTSDQVEVVTKIFSGAITVPVYKPIEDHSVKEINSEHPRNSQAEIILYSPLFGADGSFHGILHLFKVIEARSLEFQVVENRS